MLEFHFRSNRNSSVHTHIHIHKHHYYIHISVRVNDCMQFRVHYEEFIQNTNIFKFIYRWWNFCRQAHTHTDRISMSMSMCRHTKSFTFIMIIIIKHNFQNVGLVIAELFVASTDYRRRGQQQNAQFMARAHKHKSRRYAVR